MEFVSERGKAKTTCYTESLVLMLSKDSIKAGEMNTNGSFRSFLIVIDISVRYIKFPVPPIINLMSSREATYHVIEELSFHTPISPQISGAVYSPAV